MGSQQQPVGIGQRYTVSWVAYVRPAIVFLIMFGIGYVLIDVNGWLGGIFMAFGLGLLIVQVLTIHSVALYTDDQGVWVYSGIFPWSKGTSGVKWRDVEDAVYFPNFLGWLLKSYTVRIGHRFTKSSEIVLPHIARGHDAVMHINDFHRKVLTANSMDGMV
ncbi:hypothetical protein ABQJ54_13535 [Rhodanobacter sp. Si-c]|uniref:PH domain-containing protein n=1 Tax=Rhodanobacter lycopersici TaxID=3162487 RepID=A0ABV3QG50_9GAMM